MGKYSADWTEEKLRRYLKEGRGQGEGVDYKPWLTVTDFASQGRSSRIKGIKTGRIQHFLSDLETRYFFLLEWDEKDIVQDIREFYPLLDYEAVVDQKDDLYHHVTRNRKDGCPYTITTTFLITLKGKDGGAIYEARSLKSSSDLERWSAVEKLEVERRYWKAKGVGWAVITNKDIDPVASRNAEWTLSTVHSIGDLGLSDVEMDDICDALMMRIEDSDGTIRQITSAIDKDYALATGSGLFLFRNLLAKKKIQMDMTKPIDLSASARIIQRNRTEE